MKTPAFTIGQRVKAIAFTDCFDKFVPERTGLTVTEITPINGQSIPAYFRIKADDADGLGFVEGAERYFAAESEPVETVTVLRVGGVTCGARRLNRLIRAAKARA